MKVILFRLNGEHPFIFVYFFIDSVLIGVHLSVFIFMMIWTILIIHLKYQSFFKLIQVLSWLNYFSSFKLTVIFLRLFNFIYCCIYVMNSYSNSIIMFYVSLKIMSKDWQKNLAFFKEYFFLYIKTKIYVLKSAFPFHFFLFVKNFYYYFQQNYN